MAVPITVMGELFFVISIAYLLPLLALYLLFKVCVGTKGIRKKNTEDISVGFRSQRDVWYLIGVIVWPWLLLGLTHVLYWIAWKLQNLFDSQSVAEPSRSIQALLYIYFLFAIGVSPVGLFCFGAWRLICNSSYRWSLYGWLWFVIIVISWNAFAGHIRLFI